MKTLSSIKTGFPADDLGSRLSLPGIQGMKIQVYNNRVRANSYILSDGNLIRSDNRYPCHPSAVSNGYLSLGCPGCQAELWKMAQRDLIEARTGGRSALQVK